MKKILVLLLLAFPSIVYAKDINVILDIKGMTCSLCVTSVNQALRKTDQVIKAKASLKTRQAEVIVPEGFQLDKLLKAIEKTGYTATIFKVD